MNNVDRKKAVLEHLLRTRQTFIKVLVLVKWSAHAIDLQRCHNVVDVLHQHEVTFPSAADSLYGVYRQVLSVKCARSLDRPLIPAAHPLRRSSPSPLIPTARALRAPRYDVASAIDVLTTGTYPRLPTIIKEMDGPAALPEAALAEGMKRIDSYIALRVADAIMPPALKQISIGAPVHHSSVSAALIPWHEYHRHGSRWHRHLSLR